MGVAIRQSGIEGWENEELIDEKRARMRVWTRCTSGRIIQLPVRHRQRGGEPDASGDELRGVTGDCQQRRRTNPCSESSPRVRDLTREAEQCQGTTQRFVVVRKFP